MYIMQVKTPAESKGPWDYYKLVDTMSGDEAFGKLADSACPLVRNNRLPPRRLPRRGHPRPQCDMNTARSCCPAASASRRPSAPRAAGMAIAAGDNHIGA